MFNLKITKTRGVGIYRRVRSRDYVENEISHELHELHECFFAADKGGYEISHELHELHECFLPRITADCTEKQWSVISAGKRGGVRGRKALSSCAFSQIS